MAQQKSTVIYTTEELAGMTFKFLNMAYALRRSMYYAPLSRKITSDNDFPLDSLVVFQSMFYQDITNILLSELYTFFHKKHDDLFLSTLGTSGAERLSFRKKVRHPSTHVSNAADEAQNLQEFFSDGETYKRILNDIKQISTYIYELHKKNSEKDAAQFMAQLKMIHEPNQ